MAPILWEARDQPRPPRQSPPDKSSRRKLQERLWKRLGLFVALASRAADDVGNIAALFLFFLEERLVVVAAGGIVGLDIGQGLFALDGRQFAFGFLGGYRFLRLLGCEFTLLGL